MTNERATGNFSIRESMHGWKVVFKQKRFYDAPNSYIVPIADHLNYKKAVSLCSELNVVIDNLNTYTIIEKEINNRFEILDI